ncbi:uncharacterized protein LOC135838905 [Planococcus citri]|uniref:uncharacterized protein LOC135838905 n=1 Tax=Planococcus citri TaxID=170843 RepID=UPI0031F78BF4
MTKKLEKKVKALEDRIEALENIINKKSPKKEANEKLERIQHNGEVESSLSKSADYKVNMSSSDIRDPKEDEDITFVDILMNKSLFLEFITKLILICSAINVCVMLCLYFNDRKRFDEIRGNITEFMTNVSSVIHSFANL